MSAQFPPEPEPFLADRHCDRCRFPSAAVKIGQDAYGHFHKLCVLCSIRTAAEKNLADAEAEAELYFWGLEARPVVSCPFPRV